jgi:hypothetical protein
MDLQQILSPFVDRALTRGGLYGVEWNLLMLSVEDQIGEETRWLRTKFGFPNETVSRITVPSDTADLNVIWSPVMQFTGTLDNVGALIFVYESGRRNGENPGAKALLHEVVRQTSLQSRYKYPILVVNFNNTSANASDVRADLTFLMVRLLESSICKHCRR